jgi:hypothetical protein
MDPPFSSGERSRKADEPLLSLWPAESTAPFWCHEEPSPLRSRPEPAGLVLSCASNGTSRPSETYPARLTNFLLRTTMHRSPSPGEQAHPERVPTQRRFSASGCSAYRQVRLRAPRVGSTAEHYTSPPSRQNPVRHAGCPLPMLCTLPARNDTSEPTTTRRSLQRQPHGRDDISAAEAPRW